MSGFGWRKRIGCISASVMEMYGQARAADDEAAWARRTRRRRGAYWALDPEERPDWLIEELPSFFARSTRFEMVRHDAARSP
jgi:hypothetical protein